MSVPPELGIEHELESDYGKRIKQEGLEEGEKIESLKEVQKNRKTRTRDLDNQ